MRVVFLTFLIFSGINVFAQNTKLVFDQYYIDRSDFDGDYISNYDLNKANADFNADETFETYVVFHENGRIAELGMIKNSKADGVWKKWDEKGKLLERIKYKNGKKCGRLIIRDKKGKLISKGHYNRKGNKIGVWRWRNPETNQISKKDFNF